MDNKTPRRVPCSGSSESGSNQEKSMGADLDTPNVRDARESRVPVHLAFLYF
ncbi:hypothetical protein Bca101_045439 [Brassica carinata]